MHELSLCRGILDLVIQHGSALASKRIKTIYLEVGELAAIDEGALRFCFEVVAKKTIAEEAMLVIIPIEGLATCASCQKTVKIHHYADPCEACGQFSLQVIQGEALRVKSMEVA